MSTEGTPIAPLVHLPVNREVIGQIRFVPDSKLHERLADLYAPGFEVNQKSLYLSSQYRLIAEKGPGGVVKGKPGQIASRLEYALQPGATGRNHLSRYMKLATATLNDRDFLAMQFAVWLDSRIMARIDNDELLRDELLSPTRDKAVKAIVVYEVERIVKEERRERAIRAIRKYVTGSAFPRVDEDSMHHLLPHSDAYTTNLTFAFSPSHRIA